MSDERDDMIEEPMDYSPIGLLEGKLHRLPTKDNYNGYGGKAPTQRAKDALGAFHLCPTKSGGIQLSWKGENVWVEFAADGEVVGIGWEASS